MFAQTRLLLLSVFLLAPLSVSSLVASGSGLPDWLDSFIIAPSEPTDADSVRITLAGTWINSCVPDASRVVVDGNRIYFHVIPNVNFPQVCLQVISRWELSETVGPLPAGEYELYGIWDDPRILGPVDTNAAPIFAELLGTFAVRPSGPWWWPPTGGASISPAEPTSNDWVSITLSGQWPDSCIPVGSTIRREGRNIFFDVIVPEPSPCLTVITPWSQTQTLLPLPPGEYRVLTRRVSNNTDLPGNEAYVPVKEFKVGFALPGWLDRVRIRPPEPTSTQRVAITLEGIWPDTCVPVASALYRDGNKIFINVLETINQQGCGDFPTPWKLTQIVEPLPPGKYEVFGVLSNPLAFRPDVPVLIASFKVSKADVHTQVYRFIPQESVLTISGGIAGIREEVPVFGRFQLSVDPGSGKAWIDRAKTRFGTPNSNQQGDLDDLFAMTDLEGTITEPGLVVFEGRNSQGHAVRLAIRFITNSGRAILDGTTPAEPVCCDFFQYDLRAIAHPIPRCVVHYPYFYWWRDLWPDSMADLDFSGDLNLADVIELAHLWLYPCPFDWVWPEDN